LYYGENMAVTREIVFESMDFDEPRRNRPKPPIKPRGGPRLAIYDREANVHE